MQLRKPMWHHYLTIKLINMKLFNFINILKHNKKKYYILFKKILYNDVRENQRLVYSLVIFS